MAQFWLRRRRKCTSLWNGQSGLRGLGLSPFPCTKSHAWRAVGCPASWGRRAHSPWGGGCAGTEGPQRYPCTAYHRL